eukprot:Sspe_Gene.114948::Locus_101321_Transcript_1_1_Confidence_1.000_Length_615::g.114948::m.114948
MGYAARDDAPQPRRPGYRYTSLRTTGELQEELEALKATQAACRVGCHTRHKGEHCLRCGEAWESHRGHLCQDGVRGAWPLASNTAQRRAKRDGPLGKNRLLCGARCLVAEDYCMCLVVTIITAVPTVYFMAAVVPTQRFAQCGACVLLLGSLFSAAAATFMDPGIVVREGTAAPEQEPWDDEGDEENPATGTM